MKSKKQKDRNGPNIVLMMNNPVLELGIKSILARKKNLQITSYAPGFFPSLEDIERDMANVIVLDTFRCSSKSFECLVSLCANSNVREVLMVNSTNNLIQVFKKQQIRLIHKEDFANLF